MRACYQCHPGGMAGLGPAINDKPLPGWLIKTQVRQGLGAMPSFDESELSDADLEALVEYISALKNAERLPLGD
jgi:mono/diheme cytochrome c family protein